MLHPSEIDLQAQSIDFELALKEIDAAIEVLSNHKQAQPVSQREVTAEALRMAKAKFLGMKTVILRIQNMHAGKDCTAATLDASKLPMDTTIATALETMENEGVNPQEVLQDALHTLLREGVVKTALRDNLSATSALEAERITDAALSRLKEALGL
ncbi:MAG: hypothetical protein WCS85_00875 [Candidatus Peribacteraceae bacterium]|jgi:hypothetical protein